MDDSIYLEVGYWYTSPPLVEQVNRNRGYKEDAAYWTPIPPMIAWKCQPSKITHHPAYIFETTVGLNKYSFLVDLAEIALYRKQGQLTKYAYPWGDRV